MAQTVSSSDAAAPVAAYSQVMRAGDFLYVSGQIPIDPATGNLLSESIHAATNQSLANVARILESAGASLNHVVKASVFLIDPDDYAEMDAAYRATMPEPFPAREAVFVAGLPKGARVEISVIAHLSPTD